MLRQYLDNITLLDLPILGMSIFIAIFLLVLLRVLRRSRSEAYRQMANLPLQEDEATRIGGRDQ